MDKGWNLGLDIVHRVDLDAAFGGSELCPFENAQTQVNGGRVERIDIAFELEDVCTPLSSGLIYHVVGKVLEDTAVPALVGLGKVAPRDMLAHPKEVALAAMGFQSDYQVSQAFTVRQLTEHQDEELVPACEVLDVPVAMILANVVVEQTSVKERGELGENVFVFVHLPKVFGKDKFKSVSFQNL